MIESIPARTPIGHMWLKKTFALAGPRPFTESYVVAGARRTEVTGPRTVELYPLRYAVGDDFVANLRFAFRNEPIDLATLIGALKKVDPAVLETWVRSEPTGSYARRAWFFYEHFTGRRLDLADATTGNYVEVLDGKRHFVARRRNISRYRVADNLLGDDRMCPVVRRTVHLENQIGIHIDAEARAIIERYDPVILARAVRYLFTKETRSSFAIEGEHPSPDKTERFVGALRSAATFEPTKHALIQLQNAIVDPRYAASDWRDFQNFVGETTVDFREEVHFVCPRPEDVGDLMQGWMTMARRLLTGDVEPVVAAAVMAFAFVFVHPFEDGNGRIHRFLIHSVLSRLGFSPDSMIFPVSAAIVRDQRRYDEVLESFSQPLLEAINWHWTSDQAIAVTPPSDHFYRFFDATLLAEYLYDRVVDTVRTDLGKELGFLAAFDRAFEAVQRIVDMPDRRASLLVRLVFQNGGRLSAGKRGQFDELSDDEIATMEHAIQSEMRSDGSVADRL